MSRLIVALLLTVGVVGQLAAQPVPGAPTTHACLAFKKTSKENCALLAIEAMAKEKFIKAEVTADGFAYGVTEKAAVLVVATPFRDGVHFSVVVVGHDNPEVERLRNVVRSHIAESTTEPTAKQFQDGAADRKPTSLAVRWGFDQRAANPVLRHFVTASAIVVEKQGLQSHTTPNLPICIGAGVDKLGLAFIHPGPNEISAQIFAVGVGEETEADRLQRTIRKELIKVLFD